MKLNLRIFAAAMKSATNAVCSLNRCVKHPTSTSDNPRVLPVPCTEQNTAVISFCRIKLDYGWKLTTNRSIWIHSVSIQSTNNTVCVIIPCMNTYAYMAIFPGEPGLASSPLTFPYHTSCLSQFHQPCPSQTGRKRRWRKMSGGKVHSMTLHWCTHIVT